MKDDQIKQILKELPVRTFETCGSSDSFEYKHAVKIGTGIYEVYAYIQVITKVVPPKAISEGGYLYCPPLREEDKTRILYFNFVYLFFEDEDILTEDQKEIVQEYLEMNIIKFD